MGRFMSFPLTAPSLRISLRISLRLSFHLHRQEILYTERTYLQTLYDIQRLFLDPFRGKQPPAPVSAPAAAAAAEEEALDGDGDGSQEGDKENPLPVPPTATAQPAVPRLSQRQLNDIFSNIEDILQVNAELHHQLAHRMQPAEWERKQHCLGDIFLYLSPFLKIYAGTLCSGWMSID